MREVNVFLNNARLTGANVSVPQYEVQIRVEATRDDGTLLSDTRTATFPNLLNHPSITPEARNEKLKELLLWAVRQIIASGLEDR